MTSNKSTVGEQLSLFGLRLPSDRGEKPEILMDLLEISSPPKHLMNQSKER